MAISSVAKKSVSISETIESLRDRCRYLEQELKEAGEKVTKGKDFHKQRASAKLYCLPAKNRELPIQANDLFEFTAYLMDGVRNNEIQGITYVISGKHESQIVGRMGSHFSDADKAIASLFRGAASLASV